MIHKAKNKEKKIVKPERDRGHKSPKDESKKKAIERMRTKKETGGRSLPKKREMVAAAHRINSETSY